jgi:hypothetical protein
MFSIAIRANAHSLRDDCRASVPEAPGPKGRGRGSRVTARLKSCPDELRRELHDGGESKPPCASGSSLVTCHSSLFLGREIPAAGRGGRAPVPTSSGRPSRGSTARLLPHHNVTAESSRAAGGPGSAGRSAVRTGRLLPRPTTPCSPPEPGGEPVTTPCSPPNLGGETACTPLLSEEGVRGW